MHELLDLPDTNIAAIELSGTLTEDDHEEIRGHLENVLEDHITTRAVFVLDDVEGWEPDELWEDWAFDIRHVHDLDKVAIVSDDPWDRWVEKVELLFPAAHIRTFADDAQDEALEWIRGDMDVPGVGPGSMADPVADTDDASE